VDEHATEVIRVFLDTVVERLDVFAVQETQHALLQLSRALPGNDLHEPSLISDRFVDDRAKRGLDLITTV